MEHQVAHGPVVVKIGGSTLGSDDSTLEDIAALQKQNVPIVVVHGGGNVISQWMERQGTVPRFVRGLRVTDAPSLEIVTAVLTGLINTQLVAALQSLGGRALGFSGVDGGLLESRVADPELGYVGEVTKVNPAPILQALGGGYVPMVAPVGFHQVDGSEYSGSLLNINGDTVAGALARAVDAELLVFLTDVDGVMDSSGRVIGRMTERSARLLMSSGVIKGGMIPKLEASLMAAGSVVRSQILNGRKPRALMQCVSGGTEGTCIVSNRLLNSDRRSVNSQEI